MSCFRPLRSSLSFEKSVRATSFGFMIFAIAPSTTSACGRRLLHRIGCCTCAVESVQCAWRSMVASSQEYTDVPTNTHWWAVQCRAVPRLTSGLGLPYYECACCGALEGRLRRTVPPPMLHRAGSTRRLSGARLSVCPSASSCHCGSECYSAPSSLLARLCPQSTASFGVCIALRVQGGRRLFDPRQRRVSRDAAQLHDLDDRGGVDRVAQRRILVVEVVRAVGQRYAALLEVERVPAVSTPQVNSSMYYTEGTSRPVS